eukprot:scaffold2341_cov72-Phaeocystis_antarctica.AAC.2
MSVKSASFTFPASRPHLDTVRRDDRIRPCFPWPTRAFAARSCRFPAFCSNAASRAATEATRFCTLAAAFSSNASSRAATEATRFCTLAAAFSSNTSSRAAAAATRFCPLAAFSSEATARAAARPASVHCRLAVRSSFSLATRPARAALRCARDDTEETNLLGRTLK